uniref:Uncharacterized protein n=1 Tax=Arundo donax TaxID=35708 RepID=A0A0A9E3P3_ARUDO
MRAVMQIINTPSCLSYLVNFVRKANDQVSLMILMSF